MQDLLNNVKVVNAMTAAVVTADADGLDIDLQDYDSAFITVNVGGSGDTIDGSNFIELVLQVAPDDGSGSADTYVDVTSANDILGQSQSISAAGVFALINASTEDEVTYTIGYRGSTGRERFIRIQVDVTGTHTNGTPIGATAILGHPRRAPVTNT